MKPKNIREALDTVHERLFAAGSDLEHYLLSPLDYSPEYFESVRDAVLDAHMLVTWIKDTVGETK